MKTKFTYEGYMSQEAQDFFKGHSKQEDHPNVRGVSGTFVLLADGTWHLPSKNEIFTKYNNSINLDPIRRIYVSEKALPLVKEALGFDPTKTWTGEEVLKLVKSAWKAGIEHESLARRGFSEEAKKHFIENWLKENL